ncbi:hypothetical protein KUA55_17565 [Enterococcus sp. ALS3]|uniref:Transmembrane protein 231 n=1 Tax=Enterococcus alishanensis TaxID=1303817 RepID=A0ABS6THS7_9ENTE|nr:hypothetical protein [Enterococcus alishanensis]MBV7392466.1 hypothetical protein [Enterococcus alishanensis]
MCVSIFLYSILRQIYYIKIATSAIDPTLFFKISSLIISVTIPLIVLYLQRYFDNKRNEEENKPKIALGKFECFGKPLNIGQYYKTDTLFSENNSLKSEIKIPLLNIGKTPISEVSVTYEIEDFEDIIRKSPKKIVNVPDIENMIYLFTNSRNNTNYYITTPSKQDFTIQAIIDDVVEEVKFPESYVTIYNARNVSIEMLDPMISNSKQDISFNIQMELFIQYVLYMNNYRLKFGDDDDEISKDSYPIGPFSRLEPIIKFEFEFKDYKNNLCKEVKYMKLRTGGSIFSFKEDRPTQWQIIPHSPKGIK